MPAIKKLKLSIAAKISRAWPAPTVLLYLTVGSDAQAWKPDRSSLDGGLRHRGYVIFLYLRVIYFSNKAIDSTWPV